MSLINSLENKFGRFAIPGLVQGLAYFQLGVWVLIRAQPEFADYLYLIWDKVKVGQVWRLFTWMFIPQATSAIWVLFGALFLVFIGDTLEHAWGAFRLNLYVLGGMLAIIFGAIFFQLPPVGLSLYSSIFLAFCVLCPDYEIRLYFILPLKAKWLGLLDAAMLVLWMLDTPFMRLPILLAHMNFLIMFGPLILAWSKHRGVVMQRRARYASAQLPEGSFFHKCAACGKTEIDDAKLEFRVTTDGEEYCNVCRPKKTDRVQSS